RSRARRTGTTLSALRIGRPSHDRSAPHPRTGAGGAGAGTVSTSHSPVGRTALSLSADRRPAVAAPGGQERRCPPYESAAHRLIGSAPHTRTGAGEVGAGR